MQERLPYRTKFDKLHAIKPQDLNGFMILNARYEGPLRQMITSS